MMSRIDPRVARTNFVSAAGGYWKCIPRTVPRRLLKAMFACAMTGFSPRSSNSFWQKTRAKKPRLSSRRSMSTRKAPFSLVSVKIIQPSGILPSPWNRIYHAAPLCAEIESSQAEVHTERACTRESREIPLRRRFVAGKLQVVELPMRFRQLMTEMKGHLGAILAAGTGDRFVDPGVVEHVAEGDAHRARCGRGGKVCTSVRLAVEEDERFRSRRPQVDPAQAADAEGLAERVVGEPPLRALGALEGRGRGLGGSVPRCG